MFRKVLGKVVILLALCIGFIVLAFLLVPTFEGVDMTSVPGSDSWLSRVDGSKLISELYLPGSHDSATKYVDLAFFAKCQSLTIKQQLEAGVRYLDIRLATDTINGKDTLSFYHGFCRCRTGAFPWSKPLELDDVLDVCYEFLNGHKLETIVFAVKQERGSDTESFEKMLFTKIAKWQDYWYLGETVPTLEECRGKLVLVRRFEDANQNLKLSKGLPLLWADQGNREQTELARETKRTENFFLTVQDRYKYDGANKWSSFEKAILLEKQGSKTFPEIRLNFLSTNGSLAYGHPYYYAHSLNSRFLESEALGEPSWIIFDFVSPRLVQWVYRCN